MLARAGRHYRPEGLDPNTAAGQGYRLSGRSRPQAILELRLQRLTGLEQDKIVGEYREEGRWTTDLLDILARPSASPPSSSTN